MKNERMMPDGVCAVGGIRRFVPTMILVGLFLISLLFGCRRGFDPRLSAADALMEEHPDSSLVILESIDSRKLTKDEDKALYWLLRAQARDKNHLPLEEDTMIEYSIRYFKDKGVPDRLAKAYYFRGRMLYRKRRYSGAIVSFHKALELAESLKDHYLAGMSCRGISDIYNKTYNCSDEVIFAEKELEYLRSEQRQPYVNYALTDLARALYAARDIKRMNEVLLEAEDSAVLCQDPCLLSEVRRLRSFSFIRDKEFEAAYPLMADVCASLYAEEEDSLLLALTLSGMGLSDDAENVLSGIGNDSAILYHTVKYKIHKSNGDYREALAELEYVDSVGDMALRGGLSQTVSSSLSDYLDIDRRGVKAELKASRMFLLSVGCLAFTIIAVLSLSICLSVRSHRRKIEEKIRIAESLRLEVEIQRKNILKEENDKRQLLADNFQVLEDFGRIMMENPDSRKALKQAAEAVSRLLDELSGWGGRTTQLQQKVDMACDNLFSDFRADLPGLKDADYLLFLYSILRVSIPTISIILKESKIESVYNRKRRLKDKIKLLDAVKRDRYLRYL